MSGKQLHLVVVMRALCLVSRFILCEMKMAMGLSENCEMPWGTIPK